jgi:phosphonate transport system substrate-binding protein
MRRHLLRALLTAALFAPMALTAEIRESHADAVGFAILPCTNIEATFRKFYPLVEYVKKSTGITLKLVVPADLAEFETLLKNGDVDVALQDPHTYARLSRSFDKAALLGTVATNGTRGQSAVVVVRQDSGVTTLSQLREGQVLFGPRTSTAKWVAARLLFESAGIDVDRDLRAVNGGCCEDIAFAVAIRSVDAGVVCEHFAGLHPDKQKDLGVDMRALKVIARTRTFPTRVLAARLGAPRETVSALMAALLRLDRSVADHARILAAAEVLAFERTSEAEYLRSLRLPVTERLR